MPEISNVMTCVNQALIKVCTRQFKITLHNDINMPIKYNDSFICSNKFINEVSLKLLKLLNKRRDD